MGEERKHKYYNERSRSDQEVELRPPPAPQATVLPAAAVVVPSAREADVPGEGLHVPPGAIEGTHALSSAAAAAVDASSPVLSQVATTTTASIPPGVPTPRPWAMELRLGNGCAKLSPNNLSPTSTSEEGKEEIGTRLQAHPHLRAGDASPKPEKAGCACVIA